MSVIAYFTLTVLAWNEYAKKCKIERKLYLFEILANLQCAKVRKHRISRTRTVNVSIIMVQS